MCALDPILNAAPMIAPMIAHASATVAATIGNITRGEPLPSDGEMYRGFRIHFEYPPIPTRSFDWIAVDDNADGLMIANGATIAECCADVDRYIEELEDA